MDDRWIYIDVLMGRDEACTGHGQLNMTDTNHFSFVLDILTDTQTQRQTDSHLDTHTYT